MTAKTRLPRLVALTDNELAALFGVGPLGALLYLTLRASMDFTDGTAGRSTPISLHGLAMACETHTTRGAGVQITQPSEKEIRGALARLQRAGLLRRLAGDRLVFSLPLALTAPVRAFQTGQSAGADLSTEQGSAKPAPVLAIEAEHGRPARVRKGPNRAHIEVNEIQNLAARDAAPGDEVTEHRLIEVGKKRGIEPRPGESWAQFADRVFRRHRSATRLVHDTAAAH